MKILSIIAVFFSFQAMAQVKCDYHITLTPVIMMVSDSQQVIEKEIGITRLQPGNSCRTYRLFFEKGLANSYQRKAFNQGRSINYNLHPQINLSSILKSAADALSANERIQGVTEDRNTLYTNSFFVSNPGISAQEFPRVGTYTDNVNVAIWKVNQGNGEMIFEETKPLTLSFIVPQRLFVSLIEEGQVFNPTSTSMIIDFGNLRESQEKGADLRVLSNTPYKVSISSNNNGNLRHSNNSVIPYTMKVNGVPVNLLGSSNGSVQIGTGDLTQSAGDRYNLKISINAVPMNQSPGHYQDNLTITATAN